MKACDEDGIEIQHGDWIRACVYDGGEAIGRVVSLPSLNAPHIGFFRVQTPGRLEDMEFQSYSSVVLLRANGQRPDEGRENSEGEEMTQLSGIVGRQVFVVIHQGVGFKTDVVAICASEEFAREKMEEFIDSSEKRRKNTWVEPKFIDGKL